ncbi:hypothetical protein FACS1894200_01490 [Spirochaetia bacterium]|nr:hypothetical protein FACS1894200_01490 [Spirochaetia bacterium]
MLNRYNTENCRDKYFVWGCKVSSVTAVALIERRAEGLNGLLELNIAKSLANLVEKSFGF